MDLNVNFEALNNRFENEPPKNILKWAIQTFPKKIAMSSSFQMQSLPLLHMVSKTVPELKVVFLDTGYHFPETLLFRDKLVKEWQLNLEVVRSSRSKDELAQQRTNALYRRNPDLCCYVNKVEPMQQVMSELDAWISGIRRDQSPSRANTRILERTPQGIIRIHPMATWTKKDIWQYIDEYGLPEHPLFSQGYISIGCAPCTQPIFDGQDERAGRWNGSNKTECGLHTLLRTEQLIIENKQSVANDEK